MKAIAILLLLSGSALADSVSGNSNTGDMSGGRKMAAGDFNPPAECVLVGMVAGIKIWSGECMTRPDEVKTKK